MQLATSLENVNAGVVTLSQLSVIFHYFFIFLLLVLSSFSDRQCTTHLTPVVERHTIQNRA